MHFTALYIICTCLSTQSFSVICCVCVCVQEKDAESRALTEEVEILRKNEITLNLNIAKSADVSSIVYMYIHVHCTCIHVYACLVILQSDNMCLNYHFTLLIHTHTCIGYSGMAGGEDITGAATPGGPDCPTGNARLHFTLHHYNHSDALPLPFCLSLYPSLCPTLCLIFPSTDEVQCH